MLVAITRTFNEHAQESAEALLKHQEDDIEHFKKIETKMDTLATKEDIEEMKRAFEDFTKAIGFLRIGSRIGYRILLVFATIVVSIVAIGGGFRTIINWFIR